VSTYSLHKNIPVANKVDVLVAGGGPAGFAASVAAARSGANVLLVERFNCLGGTGTSGLVGPFMPTAGTDGGIYRELIRNLQSIDAIKSSWYYRIPNCFDAESYKYIAQLMCEEAGVGFLFDSFIADTLVEDGHVKGIIVANKGGLQAIEAQVVIDATGDGDVAFSAGAGYEKGDAKGRCQPTNLIFNIGGLKDIQLTANDIDRLKAQLLEERQHGTINLPEHTCDIWYWVRFVGEGSTIRDGEVTINIDMTAGIDGTDPDALTKAELDARRQVWECLRFYRKYIPGAENAYIISTAYQYGIRETRRILGKYYLTRNDALSATKFADGICKASSVIDIHGPSSVIGEEVSENEGAKNHCVPEGDWYEIPYRCLVSRGIENLLISGRCISSDRAANGSLRMMPTCMATGQAAGVAAAVSAERGVSPSSLDGAEIRGMLIKAGADL
jgi:hypothetical protein